MQILNIIVLVVFLGIMALMGIYFAKKSNSTEAYFVGNRSFPGWAVGLSMLGTSISSVTFLAFPATAFVLDWRQLMPNLSMPLIAVLAALFIIPFFRNSLATSAFEYLEKRYGALARIYAASSFIIIQLLRLATVLYLVSIPMAEMLNLNLMTVIAISGAVVAFYTVSGGIEAVIWTDVVQTIILLGGGVLCLILIIFKLPNGITDVFNIGMEFNKFSPGPIEWGLNDRTFLVLVLLGLVNFGTEYTSNQNVVQRYVAAKSTREARKATLICAFMSIPTWGCFFFLGTCLFVYYKVFPDPTISKMPADQILPNYILHNLPPGVAGIIIAACLAAAMSSLSSSINAVSTISTIDFYKRFSKNNNDEKALVWARIYALIASLIMIFGAMGIHYIPKESVNDMSLIISSLFGGGMLALYLMGFASTRVSNIGILSGLIVGLTFNTYMMLNSFHWLPTCLELPIHSYWTTIIVNLLIFVVGYIVSIIFPTKRNIEGLTFWTINKKSL